MLLDARRRLCNWRLSLLRERLLQSIEPLIESLGYELVLLEFAPSEGTSTLRLYIDREQGITLEDCETVSREVAARLDVEDPIGQAYRLEVSSPGWDRPLTKPQHFLRFIGDKAKIQVLSPVEGRKRWTGVLRSADDSSVQLDTEAGVVSISYGEIDRAQIVPDYAAEMKKRKT